MLNACLLVFCTSLAALEGVPAPQEVELERNTVFEITANLPVVLDAPPARGFTHLIDTLFEATGNALSMRHGVVKPLNHPAIYIGVADELAVFKNRKMKRFVEKTEGLPPEGYVLYIEKKQVVLIAKERIGLFRGLNTLVAIARHHPGAWPCLRIRDWPDLPLRGVCAAAPLSDTHLDQLAAVHANCILIDQPVWAYLTGPEQERYARFYAAARERYIEPIPLVTVLDRAETMLRNRPDAVEGRVVHDKLILKGDDYNVLSQRNVIQTEGSPVLVSLNGRPCKAGVDYLLEAPPMEYPLPDVPLPWMIRRIPGGAIPNGAAVEIAYSYIPEGASGWCPQTASAKAALAAALKPLKQSYAPELVHLGHGWTERLAADTRCLLSDEDALTTSIRSAGTIAAEALELKLVLFWADLFDPLAHGHRFDRSDRLSRIPRKMTPLLRLSPDRDQSAAQWQWMRSQGRPWMACMPATPAITGGLLASLEETDRLQGVLVDAAQVDRGVQQLLLQSWCSTNRPGIWPERLNAYFGATLEAPAFEERLSALIAYVNRQSVAGRTPEQMEAAFKAFYKDLEDEYDNDHPELEQVARQLDHLLRYLALEYAYRVDGKQRMLEKLPALVKDQAELDPDFGEERVERILTTLAEQELFVPAPILFRQPLAYCRDRHTASVKRIYPVTVKPGYSDTPYAVEATCDLLGAVGPLCRIDFETVHAKSLELLHGAEGSAMKPLQSWSGNDLRVLYGPLLLNNAPASPRYTLRLQSSAERAVLRELRLHAEKEAAELRCPVISASNPDKDLATLLSAAPQAIGFLRNDAPCFAEAPTEVYLCRTAKQLFVVFHAYEPRMYALHAAMDQRDAKLWEEESVELILKNKEGTPFQFLVNPLGTQFDAKGWDAAWDAAWTVSVERESNRWTAILAIPFRALDVLPRRGETWEINFKRHRANVTREDSTWAHEYATGHGYQYGKVRFE